MSIESRWNFFKQLIPLPNADDTVTNYSSESPIPSVEEFNKGFAPTRVIGDDGNEQWHDTVFTQDFVDTVPTGLEDIKDESASYPERHLPRSSRLISRESQCPLTSENPVQGQT